MKTLRRAEENLRQYYIERYFDQEYRLPKNIYELLEAQIERHDIELYALADLDDDFKFSKTWVILAGEKIFLVEQEPRGRVRIKNQFQLKQIDKIREITSLSGSTFLFVEQCEQSPLAIVRFTQRQKVAMGQLKYVIEERLKDPKFAQKDNWDADEQYAQALLRPLVEAQNSLTDEKAKTLFRLLAYLLPYKKELLIGALGAVFATVVGLLPAYVSGYLIDHVIRPFQDNNLTMQEASQIGWLLVGSIVTVYVMREIFIWLRLKKMSVLGEKVARDLRTQLYEHIQTLGLDFFSKKHTGGLISRVSSDTDRLWDFVAFGVVEVGIALITLTGLSMVLISLDWRLGLMMTLPIPFLLYSIYRHGEKMQKLFLKAWRKWSDMTAVLSDTIPGMQVVKAFGQEKREKQRFDHRNTVVTDEFFNIHEVWTRFWPVLMLGIHLIMSAVWVFALPRLLQTDSNAAYLSAGTFVSFLLYMTMFVQPIEVIGQVARMLNRALSSAYRIFEILDTRPTQKQSTNPIKLDNLKGEVEFKNVFFSYDGVRRVINNLSFHIQPGEMIGLVGSSGGGKSTITKLIARFYDANAGQILIDGQNIMDLDLNSYRKKVGMVLQDPYLFHGTIWENISYGLPKVERGEIIKAAQMANAHKFILNLPHGYETVVGERGHTLSGGERQRISIARAILYDPQILILDEATSAVDTETERNIQEALDELVQGRTVFAVAHRLSTLRKADRILVIGNGQIVEQGSHRDLLAKQSGEYAKLHRMQQELSEAIALH